jgi:hypothetical protein
MQVIEFARRLDAKIAAERPEFAKFPVNFPVSREFERGDRFEWDCVRHHGVRRERRIPSSPTLAPNWRACLARFCLCNGLLEPSRLFRPLCLCPKFLGTSAELAGFFARACLCKGVLELSGLFRGLCLCPRNSVSRKQRFQFEETRFKCAAIGWEGQAFGAGGTIRPAGRRGG